MDQARDPTSPAADPPPDAPTLRVLDGLQQGAEVPLREELPYVVGRDDDCDLVLWDDSVAPRHLELRTRAGHLRLRALDAPVALPDQALATGAAIEVAPGLAIRLGLVGIGLGPADTEWRRLPVPAPLPADWNPAPALSAAEDSEADRIAPSTDAADDDAGAIASATATPASPGGQPPVSQPPGAGRSRTPILLGGLFLTLALGLLAAYFANPPAWLGSIAWNASPPADAVGQAPAPDPAAELRTLAEAHGLAGIAIAARPDGMLELRGYCETSTRCDALRMALRTAGLRADARLWPEDRLRELLDQTVRRVGGAYLRHDYLGQGRVRLNGYARLGLSAEQLIDTLRNDVPGVIQVETDLGDPRALLADLRERLRAARLERRLDILDTALPFVATGRLDADAWARWTAVLAALRDKYPEPPPLETRVQPPDAPSSKAADDAEPAPAARPTPAAPEIRVRGILVGSGQTSYALLDNGAQIKVGDWIDDRYLVEEIRFDQVIAHDGERRKVFHLGVLSP